MNINKCPICGSPIEETDGVYICTGCYYVFNADPARESDKSDSKIDNTESFCPDSDLGPNNVNGVNDISTSQDERLSKKHVIGIAAAGVLLVSALIFIVFSIRNNSGQKLINDSTSPSADLQNSPQSALQEAEALAATYDYDGAIALLEQQEDYKTDSEIVSAISKYTTIKASLEAKDVTRIPHIFYHSLIIDPNLAFDTTLWDEREIARMNAWKPTLDEFDKITQQMYDDGWVLVRMRDLVTEKKNSDGTITFEDNKNLYLPEDKRPFVLTTDDWNYYHSDIGKGIGDKAVLDENGLVKIQYTDRSGNVLIGDYDVMPRLNSFLREHPDGAYKGARGIAALTGYNGVLGYRTDMSYKTGKGLKQNQLDYLNAQPHFDWYEEVNEAKEVAEACKAEGWEFACQTWENLVLNNVSVGTLSEDYQRWKDNVESIVGSTDTFLYDNDGNLKNISQIGDQISYLRDNGFCYFAGGYIQESDMWFRNCGDYVWQNRIDIDGYQMWRSKNGKLENDVLNGLFDVDSVFDSRRPTPVRQPKMS